MNIFFDTEFIDTGREVHLLSIGLIREDDTAGYYAEPVETDRSLACEWVKGNVLPHLHGPVKSRATIRDEIVSYVGKSPTFWADYAAYDWLCLSQLFGRMMNVPSDWPKFVRDVQCLRELKHVMHLPMQKGTQHHALDDAKYVACCHRFITHDRV